MVMIVIMMMRRRRVRVGVEEGEMGGTRVFDCLADPPRWERVIYSSSSSSSR